MAGRDRYHPSSAAAAAAGISSSSSRLTESQFPESDHNRTRSVILEDRIAIQHREIQSLRMDSERLAVGHRGLQEQLNSAKLELHLLIDTETKVKEECEANVRKVYQDALRMEAQARVVDGYGAELDRVRSDVEKLGSNKMELETELEMLDGELVKVKPNAELAGEVKKEIEVLRDEVRKGRAALEIEMKTKASNLHHERGMEKTIDHLNKEIVKLREELANVEAENREAAAEEAQNPPSSGQGASYGNSDDINGGQGYQYPEANGSHQSSDRPAD